MLRSSDVDFKRRTWGVTPESTRKGATHGDEAACTDLLNDK
ncbi:hypothetical protein F4561_000812 [Lipingzhangella halophila]|uniref:Uncharacterized protein n=1 Tax=Lipingzhangella halophila TaxID=1783352 RepID=A0A7W7RDH8_9ACTN|nr:hypothetical protein [Lipingzhangella halophila]